MKLEQKLRFKRSTNMYMYTFCTRQLTAIWFFLTQMWSDEKCLHLSTTYRLILLLFPVHLQTATKLKINSIHPPSQNISFLQTLNHERFMKKIRHQLKTFSLDLYVYDESRHSVLKDGGYTG